MGCVRVSLRALVVAILVAGQAVMSATAGDRSGSLDPSFGTKGRVKVDFGWRQAEAEDMVSQPDGKIVAAGHSLTSESASRFTLARYNKTGTLDLTFGNAGGVRSGFGPGSDAGAFALVLQPDGKLVAAGEVGRAGVYDFALLRYNADGSLDRTFGTGGKVETDIGGDDHLAAVGLQPDGKILAVGFSSVYSAFVVARYDPDGSLDVTFGSDGVVTTEFVGSAARAMDLVLQPDGKIIIVGRSQDPTTDNVALARYESNGALDQTFGSGGKVTTGLGRFSGGQAVVLQPDGRIVVGGYVRGLGRNDFVLLRYDAAGALDMTFGTDGRVATDFGGTSDLLADLALQADGKIVATGTSEISDGEQFSVARYDADGSLDPSFGNVGKVRTRFNAYTCWATSLLLQKNGKIVVGGWIVSRYESFAIARYLP